MRREPLASGGGWPGRNLGECPGCFGGCKSPGKRAADPRWVGPVARCTLRRVGGLVGRQGSASSERRAPRRAAAGRAAESALVAEQPVAPCGQDAAGCCGFLLGGQAARRASPPLWAVGVGPRRLVGRGGALSPNVAWALMLCPDRAQNPLAGFAFPPFSCILPVAGNTTFLPMHPGSGEFEV